MRINAEEYSPVSATGKQLIADYRQKNRMLIWTELAEEYR
jgi:hypothetical protein